MTTLKSAKPRLKALEDAVKDHYEKAERYEANAMMCREMAAVIEKQIITIREACGGET